MKSLEFVVVKNNDENLVYNAFNRYFIDLDLKSLINLTYRSLAYALIDAGIESINLCIEDINALGYFYNGKIYLNKNLFKTPSGIENLQVILDTLFHELTHAVLHLNNIRILTTKKNPKKFLPVYDAGKIIKIFNIMCRDYEFARASAMYFHRKNKNEFLARKNAYDMTNSYLSKYANGYSFEILPFEEKERRFYLYLYNDCPSLKNNEGVATRLLTEYQGGVIGRGIDNASEEDLKLLVASINVMLDNKIRFNLINECAKSNDIQRVNMLLSTPLIEIDQREKSVLCINHDELVLDQILFYRDDVQCAKF